MFRYYDDFQGVFYYNYMWTAEKLKSLLSKIKSRTVDSELSQISNILELSFVLAPTTLEQIKYLEYSQFEKVHILTIGEIIIFKMKKKKSTTFSHFGKTSVLKFLLLFEVQPH